MTPTQRSLKYLRDKGYAAEVVERFNIYSKTRHDLFNMWDIVALGTGEVGITGIQTTSGSNVSARIKKLQANPLFTRWVDAGNGAYVHGWRKVGPRGKRKTWQLREILLTL